MNVSRLEPAEQKVSPKTETSEREEQEVAATKIQAVFRGHQVRKEMKESDHQEEPSREQLEAEFPLDDKGKWRDSEKKCVDRNFYTTIVGFYFFTFYYCELNARLDLSLQRQRKGSHFFTFKIETFF